LILCSKYLIHVMVLKVWHLIIRLQCRVFPDWEVFIDSD
jgi:hypothetical protein